jgi:3-methyladenine DNA glycosylase/8-oxoguanine DNA glycosylase
MVIAAPGPVVTGHGDAGWSFCSQNITRFRAFMWQPTGGFLSTMEKLPAPGYRLRTLAAPPEGAGHAPTMKTPPYPCDHDAAITRLRGGDRRLGLLIDRVGPIRLRSLHPLTPFQCLLKSIVYQQLSGQAASTIYRRLLSLFPGSRPPTARRLAAVSEAELRAAGLSRAKVAAVKDLAARALAGQVPNARVLGRLSDEEIVTRLTEVRGVGRWTVEMLLIFRLGRADVLPVNDLGIRRGFMLTYGLDQLPGAAQLNRAGECWQPYRSVASWYLWRATELDW